MGRLCLLVEVSEVTFQVIKIATDGDTSIDYCLTVGSKIVLDKCLADDAHIAVNQ